MQKKIVLAIIIGMLMFFPMITSAEQVKEKPKAITNTPNEDIPSWSVGEFWTYDIEFTGKVLELFQVQWNFENLKFEVDEVAASTYNMNVDGEVTGSMMGGTLQDTTITGDATYDKSDIGIKSIDVHIEGKLRVIIQLPFSIDLTATFIPSYNTIKWPLSVGQRWYIPASVMEGHLSFTLNDESLFDLDIPYPFGGQYIECTKIDSASVGAGAFDAHIIEGINEDIAIYYASDVGNIIYVHFVSDEYTLDLDLISFSYSGGSEPGAPNKPNRPSGSTSGVPGTSYSYSSSTTDNEGDQIYYWFDWGDGSNSGWQGPFNSGETCEQSKTWNSRGTYGVKVKAKDPDGHVSPWSEPLSVNMPRSRLVSSFLQQLLSRYPVFEKIFSDFLF